MWNPQPTHCGLPADSQECAVHCEYDYPTGHGPQGDAVRIENLVRLVRDA